MGGERASCLQWNQGSAHADQSHLYASKSAPGLEAGLCPWPLEASLDLGPGLRLVFGVRWTGPGPQEGENGFLSSVSSPVASEAAAGAAHVFRMRGNYHSRPLLPYLAPEPGPPCPSPQERTGRWNLSCGPTKDTASKKLQVSAACCPLFQPFLHSHKAHLHH